jgi:chemotaxis protein MotA
MLVFVERLFEPLALLLVFGGTAVATLVTATRADLHRAMAALRPLVFARPEEDGAIADRAIRQIQRICEYKGVVCADRVKTPVEFVHRVAQRLAEAEGSEAFAAWAAGELDERQVRHASAVAVWRSAAEAAPAMGMIGTVLGLVQMFAELNDPIAMGPAMATAMLTTLYGLLIAAVVAGPIAARLERLSAAERRWQERVVARLAAVAREEEESLRQWRERRRPRLAS